MDTEAAQDTRSQILAAAERLIQDRGLAAATTRAIAEAARCAEGSIYRHFPDKHALFMEIVRTRFPRFLELIHSLPEQAGKRTVRKNLEDVAAAALGFYRMIIPMIAGAVGQHDLLHEQRAHWRETETGPMQAVRAVSTYVREEQRLGRISERLSADHITCLLLGSCFAQAFMIELVGEEGAVGSEEEFPKEIVRTLLDGMSPRRGVRG